LSSTSASKTQVSIPTDLSSLKDWADQHLSGSVLLHQRALRGAKESDYEDPSLVYTALLLLRNFYFSMSTKGGEELKRAYETELRA
jgi:hypothetical protein